MSLLIKPKLSALEIDTDLDMDGYNVTLDAGQTVDGVDVDGHSARHQNGGGDEISVAALSGELANLQKVKLHTHQSAGSGVGGKLDHGSALNGLGDDDHTQYYNSGRHTKAIHDSLEIDAGSVDGKEPGTVSGKIMYYEGASFPRYKWSADYTAGDNLLAAADTYIMLNGDNAYAKKKEITIHKAGTLRVKFTLARVFTGAGTIYGKIYKNGVAQGTERSLSVDSDGVVFSEDLAYAVDDTCELWIKTVASNKTIYEDFRIYAALPPLEIPEVTLDS